MLYHIAVLDGPTSSVKRRKRWWTLASEAGDVKTKLVGIHTAEPWVSRFMFESRRDYKVSLGKEAKDTGDPDLKPSL